MLLTTFGAPAGGCLHCQKGCIKKPSDVHSAVQISLERTTETNKENRLISWESHRERRPWSKIRRPREFFAASCACRSSWQSSTSSSWYITNKSQDNKPKHCWRQKLKKLSSCWIISSQLQDGEDKATMRLHHNVSELESEEAKQDLLKTLRIEQM